MQEIAISLMLLYDHIGNVILLKGIKCNSRAELNLFADYKFVCHNNFHFIDGLYSRSKKKKKKNEKPLFISMQIIIQK